MSFMHMDALTAATAEVVVVTLTGGTASDEDGTFAQAGWRYSLDGRVFKRENFAYTQFAAATDWIYPRTSFDPADYEVRFHRISGASTFDVGASDTLNVWHSLSSIRTFIFNGHRFHLSNNICVADIRHATDGSKNTVSSLNDAAPCMASANHNIFLEAT